MKYDQYQTLRQEAVKLIEKQLERFRPRAGNNVSIIGTNISVQLAQPEEPDRAPTWFYVVYGTIEDTVNSTFFGPHLAATIPRTGLVINDNLFEEATQVFTIPPDPPDEPGYTSRNKITYYVTTLQSGQAAFSDFQDGIFRNGLTLVLQFFRQQVDEEPVVISEHRLPVGRNGNSITIEPVEPNIFYYLRISAVERL